MNRPRYVSRNGSYWGHLNKLETKKAIYNFLEDLLNQWLLDVSNKWEFLLFWLMPITKTKKRKK